MKNRLPLKFEIDKRGKYELLDNKEMTILNTGSIVNGHHICGDDPEKHEAEFIVKACNNYYALVEALQLVEELLRRINNGIGIGTEEWKLEKATKLLSDLEENLTFTDIEPIDTNNF